MCFLSWRVQRYASWIPWAFTWPSLGWLGSSARCGWPISWVKGGVFRRSRLTLRKLGRKGTAQWFVFLIHRISATVCIIDGNVLLVSVCFGWRGSCFCHQQNSVWHDVFVYRLALGTGWILAALITWLMSMLCMWEGRHCRKRLERLLWRAAWWMSGTTFRSEVHDKSCVRLSVITGQMYSYYKVL